MFRVLLESRRGRLRRRGGAVVSVVAHVVLISVAIGAHTNRGDARAPAKTLDTMVVFQLPQPGPLLTGLAHGARASGATITLAPKGTTLPVPSPVVCACIPAIDLNWHNTIDVSGELGRAIGDSAAHGRRAGGRGPDSSARFVWQVDKPTVPLPGNPSPRYPALLREAGGA
jgi:hypothetical protein